MAVRLGAPVIPVHIRGLYEVMSIHDSWPKPGPARVRFGRPLRFHEQDDFREVAQAIEREVGKLAQEE
jgi:1-acyl-sn-glycerol-3-phosphate acyltransferase